MLRRVVQEPFWKTGPLHRTSCPSLSVCLSACRCSPLCLCVSVCPCPPPPTPESVPGLREAQRRTQETEVLCEGWTLTGGGYGMTSHLASDLAGDIR